MLQQVLAIQEKVYGKVHPRVASTLNELGRIAQQEAKVDDAEADFSRMAEIYRTVYAGKHYYIGVALSRRAFLAMKFWPSSPVHRHGGDKLPSAI
jgi:serine/threonine-protein kinase